jgi:hypothetical protein
MVRHNIRVRGVDMRGNFQKPPVVLQMNDDDFPARFLQDVASPENPQISQTKVIPAGQPLYQPVQRMLNVALADLSCVSVTYPRVDPTRIVSAGLVIRRVCRRQGINGGSAWDDPSMLSAWMRSPAGQFAWVKLRPDQENLDPDPTKRPQLSSGQTDIDSQLAALALSTANTESTTPAFAAPPATCASLGRTIVYAVIPTASNEVSDTQPSAPPINSSDLLNTLPALLRFSQSAITWPPVPPVPAPPTLPTPPPIVDYHWLSDDFVNSVYPPTPSTATPPLLVPSAQATFFQGFTLALRMLHTVFGAFDGTSNGNAILTILNRHDVTFQQSGMPPQGIGDFFQSAKVALLDYVVNSNPYPGPASPPSTGLPMPVFWDPLTGTTRLPMPVSWEPLTGTDQNDLLTAMTSALAPRSLSLLAPEGRFQDSGRNYKLRMFFRIKGETPSCPPELVWSDYSGAFQIAPWHATGDRKYPPIPLPDPTSFFVKNAKPNCTFQVPGSLMSAIQGTSLSGLMSGAGGGSNLSLGWICGFNIPLITICAFFVLNIFLSLLNIIFFWLPFIKICIPIPVPSAPDEGP